MKKYILDFKPIPTSLTYAFDEPDDKILILNKLVKRCRSEHGPIKQTKLVRSSSPSLKDSEISKTKNVFYNLRTK